MSSTQISGTSAVSVAAGVTTEAFPHHTAQDDESDKATDARR